MVFGKLFTNPKMWMNGDANEIKMSGVYTCKDVQNVPTGDGALFVFKTEDTVKQVFVPVGEEGVVYTRVLGEEWSSVTGTSEETEALIQSAIDKANQAQAKADTVDTRLNNIILESGTSDAEVVAARTDSNGQTFNTLGVRLDTQFGEVKENISSIFNSNIGSIPLNTYTDKSTLQNGAIDGTGSVTTSGNYGINSRYFDYMELNTNANHIKVIVVQSASTNFYVYVNFYDTDKNFLSRVGYPRTNITIASIPANAKYIRVTFTQITNSTLGDSNIVSIEITQYIKKGIYNGKKLYIVGDSISAGYVSMFKSEADEKGLYIQYTAPVENDGKTVVSVWDRSGTLSYWGQANEVWGMNVTNLSAPGKGYLRMSASDNKTGVEVIRDTSFDDADVIIIALGFNDWHYNYSRGNHDLIDASVPYPSDGYNTSQLTTYNQAIWYAIGEILRKAPSARLIIQTPLNGWGYGGDFSTNWGIEYAFENSGTLANIHDDIIYWCNYYGVEYLDMTYNNSIVNRVNIKHTIIDGSHPSKNAHKSLGLYVSKLL